MPRRHMEEAIRERLRAALKEKGISLVQAAVNADLNRTYLYDVFNRGRGSHEDCERIAIANGIIWEWVKTGRTGAPELSSLPRKQPPDREEILGAMECVVEHLAQKAERSDVRRLSATILAIVENPPDDMSGIDRMSRIRTGILGALRLFDLQFD